MGPGKGMLHQQPEEENKLRIDPDEVGDHMPNINSQGSNQNKSNNNLKTTEAKTIITHDAANLCIAVSAIIRTPKPVIQRKTTMPVQAQAARHYIAENDTQR